MMKEHELSEIDLRQGEQRIQIRRGGDAVVAGIGPPAAVPARVSSAAAAQTARDAAAVGPEPGGEAEHLVLIRSPMVGTFYAAPDPDSPSYVKVGDHVGPETTVCIVEAMKVFNQIPAEVAGRIVAVLVENGEPVEFGQPVFKVDTRE